MLYNPETGNGHETIKEFLNRIKRNNDLLNKIDDEARKGGEILHRIISFPYADSQAVYQIIKVLKRTVRLKICEGIGDDWIFPLIGKEGTITLEQAKQELRRRDFWKDIMKKN